MELIDAINELVFPRRCISCGELGISLCSKCRKSWNPHFYNTHLGRSEEESLITISSIPYSPIAQKIILGAKESHLKSADQLVAAAITHSLQHLLGQVQADFLIPIPSRKSASRKRGRQFITEITRPAATRFSLPIAEPLSHARKVRDQSGLNFEERWNNLAGAFVVEKEHGLRGSAVLVDDLVTTGATLVEAARALRYAGIQVIGAVTAAVAQPLR